MKSADFKHGDIVGYFDYAVSCLDRQCGIVSGVTQTHIYVMDTWGKCLSFRSSADIEHMKVSPAVAEIFGKMLAKREELHKTEERLEQLEKEIDFLAKETVDYGEQLNALLYPPKENTRKLKENEIPF